MSSKNLSQTLSETVQKCVKPRGEDTFTKYSKIVGGIFLAAVALGVLANLHDIRRYVRMSMM